MNNLKPNLNPQLNLNRKRKCPFPDKNVDITHKYLRKNADGKFKINDVEDIVNAIDTFTVEMLNTQDSSKMTLLHLAIHHERYDLAEKLIDSGVNLNLQDFCGNTSLHFAASCINEMFVHKLIAGGNKNNSAYESECGFKPLPNKTDTNVNLNIPNNYGYTPLQFAMKNENLEIAHILIEAGAFLNLKDKCENTTPLLLAIEKGNTNLFNCLINKGADVNQAGKDGIMPLHLAVQINNGVFFQGLIDKGADTKIKYLSKTALNFVIDQILDHTNEDILIAEKRLTIYKFWHLMMKKLMKSPFYNFMSEKETLENLYKILIFHKENKNSVIYSNSEFITFEILKSVKYSEYISNKTYIDKFLPIFPIIVEDENIIINFIKRNK